MYSVTMIVLFILALGMGLVAIANFIVNNPPDNIEEDLLEDLQIIVDTYYSGDLYYRFNMALTMGGFAVAEVVHYLINLGKI